MKPLAVRMINRSIFFRTRCDEMEWQKERQSRVTASMAGSVVKAQTTEIEQKIADRHTSSNLQGWIPRPCQYGKIMEPQGRLKYIEVMRERGFQDVIVYPCGLAVCQDNKNLGCSPDGLVRIPNHPEFSLICLEIKTVYDLSAIPKSLEELVESRPNFYLKWECGRLQMRNTHSYWYQIQTQLGVLKLQLAHLAVFIPRRQEIHIFEIPFDPATWAIIVEKSNSFAQRYLSSGEPMTDDFVGVEELLIDDMTTAEKEEPMDWE